MIDRKEVTASNAISEIVTLNLGGYEQKVLIEGKTGDLPVVIMLHGGPGSPFPFGIGMRGMHPEFTGKYILVSWDQLGCGANNHKIDESFTIDSFVEMAKDLALAMRERFPGQKVLIYAVSWGSVISARLAAKYPETIDGAVVFGQLSTRSFFTEEVMNTLEKSPIPPKELAKIKAVNTDNISFREISLVARALQKYTDAYSNKNAVPEENPLDFKDMFTSPDYKFKDKLGVAFAKIARNRSLFIEISGLDLTSELSSVTVPYHILQGETDIVASTKSVQTIVEASNNKNLTLDILKNAGHLGSGELMGKVLEKIQSLAV